MRHFLQQAKDFYIKDFLTTKGMWRKPYQISILLVIIENIQLFSLITQSIPEMNNASYLNPIHFVMDLFRIYPIIGDAVEVHIIYMLMGFVLTFLSFILLVYLILNTKSKVIRNSQLQEMTLERSRKKRVEEHSLIMLFISVYMQIYQTIIRIPMQFSHLHVMYVYQKTDPVTQFMLFGTIISFFSISLQFLFSFFIDLHCFEFRMKKQDFLGKFNNYEIHIIFAFQTGIILLAGLGVTSILIQIIYLIYLMIVIFVSYQQLIYVEIKVSRLQLQISTLFLCYQLTLIFAQYEGNSLKINLLQFLLLFFPICISLLKTLIERQKITSLQFASKSLEKQIRMIYYLFKKQIKLKKEQRSLDPLESLFMYSFITNHLRYCKLNRERKAQKQIKMRYKCFCEEYSDNENFRFDSIDQMKIFAKDMIAQTLEDEILENQNTYLALIYIYFLVQVKKLPTQAIYEVIRLSLLSKGMAIKEQAIIYKLKYDALEEFDQLVKKNDLKNQKYVFKRVYQYEESLSIVKCNLIILAKQFKVNYAYIQEWYSLILTTIIDADQLVQLGFDILTNVSFIEKQLQTAFKINPLSNECDTIYNLFQKYFLFNRVRPKLYRIDGKLVTQFMQSIEKVIFDPGSCVIQITLLQPRGNVIRYTRSFQQAIGFKDEEIQDQNIHRFMPQIIADDHDRYLDNFVERGRIIVVRSEVRVILGKTKGQFLVPINTRLRIETGPTEFGATALITPVNLTFGYMMLNDKGEIEEITQNIFQEMFQKHLGIKINQIRGLDCLFFVPDLAKIWEEIYDENFDKLDRKFECQFIMPMISQSRSTSQTQLTMTKSIFQRQIYRNFENQPTENAIYQVTLHVISLVTINLKLVILELQEFKLLPNQKITSKQLVQLRGRSSQQFQQNNFQQNTSSYREQLSLLNSPWVIDCDLDNQLLQEEERMMDEVKVQLATVNITNTTHQQGQLIQYAENEEEDDQEEGEEIIQKKEKQSQKSQRKLDEQSITSALKDEDPRKVKNNQINQNASIGSRSSQNNQSQLKRLMKDCFQQQRTIDTKLIFTLVFFYVFLLAGYVANFLVIYNNFQLVQNNQSSQDLPFQLSYFYNEFVISEFYFQYDSVFPFSSLQQVSLNFYQENIKQIDAVMSILPELDNLQTISLQQQIIEVIKQMIAAIQDTEDYLNSTDYLNNTNYFEKIADALYEADTTHNLINLEYIVLAEEILVVCFMLWYVYKSLVIIKMKSRVYRLFTTFTTDVIQEHYIQFSTLYSLMNSSKFKKEETDEERFEYNVKSVYVKQGTQIVLEKNQKVGKRMRSQRNNSTQFILILFVIVLIIVFSVYFAGSYFLHSATLQTILEVFKDKKMFSKTYHEITLAYAQSTIFMNSVITSDMITIQNTTLAELQALQKKVSLYTTDQTIYNIIKDQACNIFLQTLSGIESYDNLFSYEQCSSYQTLQMGLNVILSSLCNIQLQFYEDMIDNIPQSQLQQRYFSIDTQILRLYDSMGFFVIVSELKSQIQMQVENTTKINIILVICCGTFMSLSIIVMIIQKQKIRNDYHKSKQLLTLLPYDRLLENAYIISFIQKDSKLFK